MAYQPPNSGQYPSSHPPPLPPPSSPYGPYSPTKYQAYPQVVLPGLASYAQQPQPDFQVHQNLPNQAYQPQQIHHPTPPLASPLQGGSGSTYMQFEPFYGMPSTGGTQSYPYSQYSQQQHAPPRPQSQPLPAPANPPPQVYYSQSQMQPPPPRPQQRAASDAPQYPTPQVLITASSLSAVQSGPSASRRDAGQQYQGNRDSGRLPIDYQMLLLALADEYLDAAHSQGTKLAVSGQEMEVEEYFKLVATALGCLEAVLMTKKSKLHPRTEALVRLQYARILFEETENDAEAEAALSKGIDLCERNKMFDIKYSMAHLLCRIMFKSNPKAAVKAVDGVIADTEAYRHVGWEYAFRLLRVTLSLASSSRQDSIAALSNLQKLSGIADDNGDHAISAVSSIVEALVYLRQSPGTDAIEQAQRAIGAARTHQLDPSISDLPQLQTLIQMVDICCSLLVYDITQASQKLQAMQKTMDENISNSHWRDDGSFSVPLQRSTVSESGDVLRLEDGTPTLTLSWLSEHDLYSLCYFLSSVTLSAKNSQDGHKSEKYLSEGLRMIQSGLKKPHDLSEPVMSADSRLRWRQVLHCNMLLQQVFLACSRTDWKLASRTLETLQEAALHVEGDTCETIKCLMEYSRGVVAQGTGDLKRALAIYQQPIFAFDRSTNKTARNNPRRDISILAGLNRVLILRDPLQPSQSAALEALADLEEFCKGSPSKYVQAAYSLISATQTTSTIQTKKDLQIALQTAMAISNLQVTCIALTFMSWKYFRGVVGEQSEKSARAAKAMARKSGDKLWISVTEELLAETLDRQGKTGESRASRAEADRILPALPPALKKMKKTVAQGGPKIAVEI